MDKNSIWGLVLIALIMMGFFAYQSRVYNRQLEYQAQLDSIAAVEQHRQDSIRAAYLAEHPGDTVAVHAAAASAEHAAPWNRFSFMGKV